MSVYTHSLTCQTPRRVDATLQATKWQRQPTRGAVMIIHKAKSGMLKSHNTTDQRTAEGPRGPRMAGHRQGEAGKGNRGTKRHPMAPTESPARAPKDHESPQRRPEEHPIDPNKAPRGSTKPQQEIGETNPVRLLPVWVLPHNQPGKQGPREPSQQAQRSPVGPPSLPKDP